MAVTSAWVIDQSGWGLDDLECSRAPLILSFASVLLVFALALTVCRAKIILTMILWRDITHSPCTALHVHRLYISPSMSNTTKCTHSKNPKHIGSLRFSIPPALPLLQGLGKQDPAYRQRHACCLQRGRICLSFSSSFFFSLPFMLNDHHRSGTWPRDDRWCCLLHVD